MRATTTTTAAAAAAAAGFKWLVCLDVINIDVLPVVLLLLLAGVVVVVGGLGVLLVRLGTGLLQKQG